LIFACDAPAIVILMACGVFFQNGNGHGNLGAASIPVHLGKKDLGNLAKSYLEMFVCTIKLYRADLMNCTCISFVDPT
jgi:hypothetical protein